jgi:hypothetical protein
MLGDSQMGARVIRLFHDGNWMDEQTLISFQGNLGVIERQSMNEVTTALFFCWKKLFSATV